METDEILCEASCFTFGAPLQQHPLSLCVIIQSANDDITGCRLSL